MNYYYAHLQCISILIIFVLYLYYIHILHRWHGGHFKRWLKSHNIDINSTLNNKYVAILSYTNVIPLLRQFRNALYTYHINIPFTWSLSLLSIDASSTELTQAYDTAGNTSETINRYPYSETINRLENIYYYYEGTLLPMDEMNVVIREIPEYLPVYNAPIFTPTPVPIRPTTHISSGPYATTPYTTHTYNPITTTSTANNTANSSTNNSSNNSIVGLAPVVPSTIMTIQRMTVVTITITTVQQLTITPSLVVMVTAIVVTRSVRITSDHTLPLNLPIRN